MSMRFQRLGIILICVVVAYAGGCAQMKAGWDSFVTWCRRANITTGPKAELTTQPVAVAPENPEDLSRVMLDRPEVPLTVCRDPGAAPKPEPDLPADGSMVISARCKLVRESPGNWYVVDFLPEGAEKLHSRRVLPSQLLEKMESLAAAKNPPTFRVTGETTIYDDTAYILLRRVTVEMPPAPKPAKIDTRIDKPRAATQPAKPRKKDSRASSDEVFKSLLKDKPGRPVLTPSVDGAGDSSAESVAPQSGARMLIPSRSGLVVDRVVTILPEKGGKWWLVRFNSDNTLREPPIRLLPCALLAEAIRGAERNRYKVFKFRVSGEITRYKGRRYLLIRKLLDEREMGQF